MKVKNTYQRIIAMVLSFVMVLGLITVLPELANPTVAHAATYASWEAAGKAAVAGTDYTVSGTTYHIKTAKGLAWVANQTNSTSGWSREKTFYLDNDIDLGGQNSAVASGSWNSIGNEVNDFYGSFNGQNHTVSGLYINNSESSPQRNGFFGNAREGIIQNLNLANVSIKHNVEGASNDVYVGGIAGGVFNIRIINCSVSGTISGKVNVAGIVGGLYGNSIIINCTNTAILNTNPTNVGTTVPFIYMGGIVARHYLGKIINCYNLGDLNGRNGRIAAGGILGTKADERVVVSNCYSTGKIAYIDVIEGITAGIVGVSGVGIYDNNFMLNGSVSGSIGTEKTLAEMQNASFVTTLNNWVTANIGTYPELDTWKATANYFPTFSSRTTTLTVTPPDNVTYNGASQTPKPKSVKAGNTTLTEGTHYTLSYPTDTTSVGVKNINIVGKGTYAGWSGGAVYTVNQKAMSSLSVTAPGNVTYNGASQKPKPVVKDGSKTLVENTDYTLSYPSDTTSAGSKTITINAKNSNYTGSTTTKYTINAKNASTFTVTAPANQTYTGAALTPAPVVKDGSKTLVKDTDYTLTYANNTNVGTATVTITGKGNYTGTKTTSFTIAAKNASTFTVTAPANQTYTGAALTPKPVVKNGSTTLTENTHYTLSYANNTNVGTATVTITGKGNYAGTKTTTFTIAAKNASTFTVTAPANQTYTGGALTPKPVVKDGSTTLSENTHYTLSYTNNTNVGTATVTITGKGNYTGTKTTTFTIAAKNASTFTVTPPASQTYTGAALTPKPVVKDGSKTLTENTHYTLSYANNTNAGTATVTITGKGNYTGTKPTTFTINKATMSAPTVANYDKVYDGAAHTISVSGYPSGSTIKYGTAKGAYTSATPPSYTAVGTYNIFFQITNNNYNPYEGYGTVKISQKNASAFTIGAIGDQTYTGLAITPGVTVKDGNTTLANPRDYTVGYSANTNVGTATVTVYGTGNYTGSKETTFKIVKANQGNLILMPVSTRMKKGENTTLNVTGGAGDGALSFAIGYAAGTEEDSKAQGTVSGGILTATRWGKMQLTATKAASANYNAVTSTPVEITVYDVPSVPGGAKAVSGTDGTTLTLSWTAAADHNDSIKSYVIYEVTGEGESQTEKKIGTVESDELSYTHSGLSKGTAHNYKIYAENSAGKGPGAEVSGTTVNIPSKLTDLTAEVKSGTEAKLTWTKPSDGGSALTGYTVKVYRGEAESEGVTVGAVDMENSTVTVSGLTKGETYTFGVYAQNAAGSAEEARTVEVTMWNDPSAATQVKLEAGDGQIKVSWGEPENSGNNPVSQYNVYLRESTGPHPEDGGWTKTEIPVTEAEVDEASGLFTHTLTGLEIAVWYDIQIGAVNGSGETLTSVYTKGCTRLPDVPEIGGVKQGNNGAVIESIRVENNGGMEITEYRVYAAEVQSASDTPSEEAYQYVCSIKPVSASDTYVENAEVSGLENGKQYKIKVSAVNGMGESAGKSNIEYVYSGLPTVPGNFKAEAAPGQKVVASYSASDGNGSEILGYRIYLNGASEPSETITGLEYTTTLPENGDSITIAVSSYSAVGESAKTEAITVTAGTPSVPEITGVRLYSAEGSENNGKTGLDVQWSESESNGNKLTGYRVYLTETGEGGGTKEFAVEKENGTLARELNIPSAGNLEYGRSYRLEVTAENLIGSSGRSEAETFTYGVPGTPEITKVEASPGELTVHWTAAQSVNSEIKAYRVYVNRVLNTELSWLAVEGGYKLYYNGKPSETVVENLESFSCKLSGLANGSEYRLQVSAVNGSGEGLKSEPLTGVPATSASEVREVEAKASGSDTVKLSWKAPYTNGGSSITGYEVKGWNTDSEGMRGEQLGSDQITQETALGRTAEVSGLELGKYYVFEVRALTRAEKAGAAGVSNVVRTYYAPSAPEIVKLESGSGTAQVQPVKVTWTAPEDTGGPEITGYDIYIGSTKLNSEPIGGELTSCEVTDSRLQRGKTYALTMTATNAAGETSEKSGSKSITIGTPPAPEELRVTSEANRLKVEWSNAPLSGSVVDGFYIYTGNPLDNQAVKVVPDPAATSAELELQSGKQAEIYVAAYNNIGTGAYAGPVKIVAGAPKAPEVTGVTAGYEEIKVSWKEAELVTPGDAMQKYSIYVDGAKAGEIETSLESTFEYTIREGIEGGRKYRVSVSAESNCGEGQRSEELEVTPWSTPGLPEITGLEERGNGWFSFGFVEPKDCGLEVTGCRVYVDGVQLPERKSESGAYAEIDRTAKKVKVIGVSNGQQEGKDYGHLYYVTAVVTPPSGEELESRAPEEKDMEKVTTGIPTVPEIEEVTPGDGSARVKWSESDGLGSAVDYYEVEYGGAKPVVTTDTMSRINGTNGEALQIKVRAHNAVGYSEYSEEVVTVPGTPTTPEITRAESGDGSISIEWSESTANAGTLKLYQVYLDGAPVKEVDGKTTSAELENLTNGQEYKVSVSAVNSQAGEGSQSKPVKVTPGREPGEVEDLSGKAVSDSEVELSWTAPKDKGGFSSLTYTVEGEGEITVSSAGCKARISGLKKGTDYSYVVKALNAKGSSVGKASGKIRTMTNPGNPQLRNLSGTGKISVKWFPVSDGGGSEVKGYNIYLDDAKVSANAEVIAQPSDASLITQEILAERYEDETTGEIKTKALETGHEYKVTVKAVNEIGLESEPGNSLWVTVTGSAMPTKPNAPEEVKVKAGDRTLTVSWKAPEYTGNVELTGYRIFAGSSAEELREVGEVDAKTLEYTVTKLAGGESLVNGSEYYVSVKAKNAVDYSEYSKIETGTPNKEVLPDAPTWPKLDNEAGTGAYISAADGNSIRISWNAVETAVRYEVNISTNNGEKTEKIPTSETSLVYTGTVVKVPYTITVSAVNETGGKSESTPIYAYSDFNVLKEAGYEYPPHYSEGKLAYIDANYDSYEDTEVKYTVPGLPKEVGTKVTGKKMEISWKAPEDNGNGTVSQYHLYVDPGIRTTFNVDSEGNPSGENAYQFKREESGLYRIIIPIESDVLYSVQVSARNEKGEGERTQGQAIYVPQITAASEVAAKVREGSLDEIEISWTAPEVENLYGYRLYVNAAEQELHEKTGENPEGYTVSTETDPETQQKYSRVKYLYAGEFDKEYVISVSALYDNGDTESRISNRVSVSTKPVKPEKPVITAAVVAEEAEPSGRYRIDLNFTEPPNVEVDSYKLYVNGEETEGFERTETGGYFLGEAESNLIVRLSGVKRYGEVEVTGEQSEAKAVSTVKGAEVLEPEAPIAPENVKAELKTDANGNLEKQDNLSITWDAVQADGVHQAADGYNVLINNTVVNGETAVPDTNYTYTAEAGKDYSIQIQPMTGGLNGAKSAVIYVTAPAETYPAPEQVQNGTAEYDEVSGTITVNFDAVEGADYYVLYNNGAVYEENGTAVTSQTTSFEITAELDTDYAFQVSAVKVYPSDGTDRETEGMKSEIIEASTKAEEPEVVLPTAAGKPSVTRAVSDGISNVKIYWKAPEKQENEIGEIDGYHIYIGGKALLEDGTLLDPDSKSRAGNQKLLLIPADSQTEYGEYGYLFRGVGAEILAVSVTAVKIFREDLTPISSESSKVWKINRQLNIVSDETVFTKDENQVVTAVNDDPEVSKSGIVESTRDDEGTGEIQRGKVVKVTGKVSGVTGPATVTFHAPDNRVIKAVATGADGSFELEATIEETPVTLAEGDTTTGGYSVKVTKQFCTYYEVTDIDISQVETINLSDVELHQGDVNEDGKVDGKDATLIKGSYGSTGKPEELVGDVNGDGKVDGKDATMIKGSYSKGSVSKTYAEFIGN